MLVENVKALQLAQKEIANAVAALDVRLRRIEAELLVVKAETKLEAVKETQQMLNAVQGAFHEKLTDLTVRIAHVERHEAFRASLTALSPPPGDHELPPA
jgi:hypothetical protein